MGINATRPDVKAIAAAQPEARGNGVPAGKPEPAKGKLPNPPFVQAAISLLNRVRKVETATTQPPPQVTEETQRFAQDVKDSFSRIHAAEGALPTHSITASNDVRVNLAHPDLQAAKALAADFYGLPSLDVLKGSTVVLPNTYEGGRQFAELVMADGHPRMQELPVPANASAEFKAGYDGYMNVGAVLGTLRAVTEVAQAVVGLKEARSVGKAGRLPLTTLPTAELVVNPKTPSQRSVRAATPDRDIGLNRPTEPFILGTRASIKPNPATLWPVQAQTPSAAVAKQELREALDSIQEQPGNARKLTRLEYAMRDVQMAQSQAGLPSADRRALRTLRLEAARVQQAEQQLAQSLVQARHTPQEQLRQQQQAPQPPKKPGEFDWRNSELFKTVRENPQTPGAQLLLLDESLTKRLAKAERDYGLKIELTDDNVVIALPGGEKYPALTEYHRRIFEVMGLPGMDSFRDTSDSQTWQMSRLVHSKLSTVISDHFRRPGKTLAEAVSAKPGTPGARLLTLMLTLNPRLANKLARQEKTYGLEFELTDNNLLVGWPGSKQRLLLDERDTETFWRMSLVGTDALLLRSEEYVRRLSAMIEFEVDHLIHRNSLTRLDDD